MLVENEVATTLLTLPDELMRRILLELIDNGEAGWPRFYDAWRYSRSCTAAWASGRALMRSLPDSLRWIFGSAREQSLVHYTRHGLWSLQLANIGMQSPGLVRLLAALREKPTLYLLDISYNDFILSGTRALLHSLKDSSFLPQLTVLLVHESRRVEQPEEDCEQQVTELEEFEGSARVRAMSAFVWSDD